MEKYLAIAGGLVFVVQLTIQLIKELPLINKVPTSAVTMILSIVYSELALVIYAQYVGITPAWYLYVGTFFGGLVVAYVAMYGWEKLKELWERSKTK
jgi:hypothetical protein